MKYPLNVLPYECCTNACMCVSRYVRYIFSGLTGICILFQLLLCCGNFKDESKFKSFPFGGGIMWGAGTVSRHNKLLRHVIHHHVQTELLKSDFFFP